MSFRNGSDPGRPGSYEECGADITGGKSVVVGWKHVPDLTSFDDATAFHIIRQGILQQNNDPQRLRKTAIELAALLPAGKSFDVLSSLWNLFISLAQQTPSSNLALLDLVVILDHLSASPKSTAIISVGGFEQFSRLHGLNQRIRDHLSSSYGPVHVVSSETPGRWVSLNAFAALLWSYNLIDGRDHAIQQLRSAFEERPSSDANDRQISDARLMAAAQWAIHSCHRLYHLSVTSQATYPVESGAKSSDKRWSPGARFKGRGGFSFRRWEFWMQGFEEADEFGNGGIEAKAEAGAANGMMEKVMYAGFEQF